MSTTIAETLIAEFKQEAVATRKMLERVPEDKLDWRPHEKSMNLGLLASHLADLPEWVATITEQDEVDIAAHRDEPWVAASTQDLLEKFDQCAASFAEKLRDKSDETLLQTWTLKHGENEILSMPRIAVLRSFVMNHSVHHRGQLSVYLRLLEVALPQVYGQTADEPGGL